MTAVGSPVQVSHASGLHAVNRVLSEMHRDMLRTGGIEGGAVRLTVLNLVAACVDEAGAVAAALAVSRLGVTHPARAIIVVADAEGADHIEADVSLQCSLLDADRVCAELVSLHVGGEVAYHLASVVTPLLVPDIPVYLWLVGSPPVRQAFGQDAIAICERLIIDTGEYEDDAGTLRVLADQLEAVGDAISLSDVAWERIRTWREVIAHSFDGDEVRAFLGGVTAVDVECSGERVSAQTWLIAGWLASRLGWTGESGSPSLNVTARLVKGVEKHDLVRVALRCSADGHEALVTVERRGGALHSVIDVDGGITAERTVPVPELGAVDVVGTLVEDGREDPAYRAALRAASELSTGSL